MLKGVTLAAGSLAGTALAGVPLVSDLSARDPGRGRALSPQALEDALVGSSYLGCGGGGRLSEARALIADDIAAGRTFRMLPVSALGDAERVASPYALGSLADPSPDMQAALAAIPRPVALPVLSAFALLERHLGTQLAAVTLGEIGPLSMAEGLSVAARLGRPALDADTVGRATPEITQHSVRVAGHDLTPAAAVTPFGDEMIVTGLADPDRQEAVLRAVAVASALVSVADAPITGRIAKQEGTLVTGSLSLAERMGRAAREARARGADGIDAARAANDGYALLTGTVAAADWRDEDGFLVGTVTIEGRGPDAGRRMTLDVKNEYLVARIDGAVAATCPDLITVINEETAEGVTNPDIVPGQAVRVLGFACAPLWRTPAGLAVFRPAHFGYDVPYVPIEARRPG